MNDIDTVETWDCEKQMFLPKPDMKKLKSDLEYQSHFVIRNVKPSDLWKTQFITAETLEIHPLQSGGVIIVASELTFDKYNLFGDY